MEFSPDSKFIAIACGRHIHVWHSPALITQYRPMKLHRTYTKHTDDVTHIEWTSDSQYFASASKDMSVRIFSLHPQPGFVPLTLAAHKAPLVACFFLSDAAAEEGKGKQHQTILPRIYTVAKDGSVYMWEYDQKKSKNSKSAHQIHRKAKHEVLASETPDSAVRLVTGRYLLTQKAYMHQRVVCATLHRGPTNLLITGFKNGVFALYELPGLVQIHSLSMSQSRVTAAAVNSTGDWLAFGCADRGQLLVWEWQSESYILKQQGHALEINSAAFSPDGLLVDTGGDDGKVKLWNSSTGFCFVTFSEHTAPVSSVAFSATGTVIFSASLDGTVRAYDLVRYRNFRTLSAGRPVTCVSVYLSRLCVGLIPSSRIFYFFFWVVVGLIDVREIR